ncbi:uncharacterized protein LOC141651379 [Silene latifolia]|uniref:uncharacterized protein LOC141651379 n=1 Tax=Silene latifolia TaxID=37657 RepID=UPI003D78243A
MSMDAGGDVEGHVKEMEEKSGWSKPRQGRVKVNVDAAVLEGIRVGWGSVGRDEQGKVLWYAVTQQRSEMSVGMAEAVGIWHGLEEAIKEGHQEIDMESDCAVVVGDLQRRAKGRSELHLVYDDIYLLCNSFQNVCFKFTRRKNNKVAHK